MAEYEIILLTPTGVKLDVIDDWLSVSYGLVLDSVGTLVMTLPPSYPLSYLRWDGRLIVSRDGKTDGETPWFIREIEPSTAADGSEVISCTAYSGNYLLSGRVVAYQPGTAQANKTDRADSLMVAVVKENLGSDAADMNRNLSQYLSIQPSASLGPTVPKEMAWNNVLDVLREVAQSAANQGSPVHFDVVAPTQSTLEFRTYRGQRGMNHTVASGISSVTLSLENKNLGGPIRYNSDRAEEITFAYTVTQGTTSSSPESASDSERIIVSPFNRREAFVRAGTTSASTGLVDVAGAAVREGRPKRIFEAAVLDVPGTRYGTDWGFGDILTAEYVGEIFDVSVNAVSVRVVNGQETITARLRAED